MPCSPGAPACARAGPTFADYSALSYTNNSGQTENAFLMLFGFGDKTGTVDLSGVGEVPVNAGSVVAQGSAGVAFTSGSSSPQGDPDPWLYMFDYVPGQGNGAFNDDSPLGGRDSKIADAVSTWMWYVPSAYGSSSGTTTVNY